MSAMIRSLSVAAATLLVCLSASAEMSCPTCQAAYPDDTSFCPKDGARLLKVAPTCAGCGRALPAEAKFCPNCGAAVQPRAPGAASAAAAPEATYLVRLFRPVAVGMKGAHQVWAKLERRSIVSRRGKVQKDEHTYLEAAGRLTAEVRQTSAGGKSQAFEAVFDELAARQSAFDQMAPSSLVGVRLAVGQWPEMTFARADGQLLTPSESAILSNIFEKVDPDGPSEDELFGRTQPVKPGERWPAATAGIARVFGANIGVPLRAEQVAGATELVGVEKVDGIDCLRFRATAEVALDTFQGLRNVSGKATMEFVRVVPVDPARAKVSDVMTVRMQVSGAVGDSIVQVVLEGVRTDAVVR